ncbi:methyl coenzyme M reductase subunit gamma [Rothia mucilaginosa]|uniref:methyl coenzyme M reductase subunit gamma n=1 Tax=Rothia mucilaginosa TaxID=43675 RepID=UPI0028D4ED9A|nr:methyl coenzyme M reductase subunit gamma [Rothia mucilaginosa]
MKTVNYRPVRTTFSALSAAMLLLGLSACADDTKGSTQNSSSSSTASSSAPASAPGSASSSALASAVASSSPAASDTTEPKGSEVIEIRAADDTNADPEIAKEAAIEAAKRVAVNDNRMFNAWMHGDLEHVSDEELLKFVAPEKLSKVKETIQSIRDGLQDNNGGYTGNVTIRDVVVSEVLPTEYSDGSSYPYSHLRVKYCEDWTQLHTSDGKRAIVGPESTNTVELLVLRLQDGRYVYAGARDLSTGCASS